MRTPFRRQVPLSAAPRAHHRATDLAGIDRLLEANPALVELVTADLPHTKGAATDNGRPGMSGDQVLRAALVRALEMCSYEELAFYLDDSQSYRSFCRLGWGDTAPSDSTLQENIRRVKPATWVAINDLLVKHAVDLGVETGTMTRIDCTVTDSTIHPPDDAMQLYDTVRVLVRLLRKAEQLRPGVVVHSRTKRAKRRQLQTMDKKEPDRVWAFRDLLHVAGEVVGWTPAAITLLRASCSPGDVACRLAQTIERFAEMGRKVIDQTRRRVIENEKVPASEKVLSIFEPHTDIIIKDRREVLYGHKLLLGTGAAGLVHFASVLDGNPADSTLVERALDGVAAALGKMPRQAAMDGGFASVAGLALAKSKGVKDVCFSKRRGMKVTDMAKSEWVYRRLWRFRVGVEAGISWLKRCFGLSRSAWKGLDGFHAYVHSNIATFNLLLLGRLTAV